MPAEEPSNRPNRPWYSCRFGTMFWVTLFVLLWILADTMAVVNAALRVVPELYP
jgi:hypothetical protein